MATTFPLKKIDERDLPRVINDLIAYAGVALGPYKKIDPRELPGILNRIITLDSISDNEKRSKIDQRDLVVRINAIKAAATP